MKDRIKENFTDIGNGKYDFGEDFIDTNGKYDKGEKFTDSLNRVWDPPEDFVDSLFT